MKKKVTVSYRDEFTADIMAEGDSDEELCQDALDKFENNKCKIVCIGAYLDRDYVNVVDAKTGHDLTL